MYKAKYKTRKAEKRKSYWNMILHIGYSSIDASGFGSYYFFIKK